MSRYNDDEEYYQYFEDKKAEEQREYNEWRDHEAAMDKAAKDAVRDAYWGTHDGFYGNGDYQIKDAYNTKYADEETWLKRPRDDRSDTHDLITWLNDGTSGYSSSSMRGASSSSDSTFEGILELIKLFIGAVIGRGVVIIGLIGTLVLIGVVFRSFCLFILLLPFVLCAAGYTIQRLDDALLSSNDMSSERLHRQYVVEDEPDEEEDEPDEEEDELDEEEDNSWMV